MCGFHPKGRGRLSQSCQRTRGLDEYLPEIRAFFGGARNHARRKPPDLERHRFLQLSASGHGRPTRGWHVETISGSSRAVFLRPQPAAPRFAHRVGQKALGQSAFREVAGWRSRQCGRLFRSKRLLSASGWRARPRLLRLSSLNGLRLDLLAQSD